MRIGYIRISKQEQNEALQRDALKEAGCEKYFSDTMTGVKFERRGLEKALAFLRSGDMLVVWKLDRLGCSLKDLIETLNLLKERNVDFISLTESLFCNTGSESPLSAQCDFGVFTGFGVPGQNVS